MHPGTLAGSSIPENHFGTKFVLGSARRFGFPKELTLALLSFWRR